jgi:hypothetical protein
MGDVSIPKPPPNAVGAKVQDLIETVRGQVASLTEQETKLRKALDEYLLGLDLQ